MSLIKASGRTFVEELATNPQVNLMVVCERLGVSKCQEVGVL